MGVLPDRLPGYAYTDNAGAREMLEQIWGGVIPSAKRPDRAGNGGSRAVRKIEGAVCDGRESAGTFRHAGLRARKSATAGRARNVFDRNGQAGGHRFSGGLRVRKRRHGHQHRRRNPDAAQGRRNHGPTHATSICCASFRINWKKLGLGKAFHYKNPAAVFEEIRKTVPGYNVQPAGLLKGEAEPTHLGFTQQRARAHTTSRWA